ncbi:beta-1,4 N-acetylgalactosaminyltransferase 2-like [Bolinopsis microptera]|uniref:beta-1,4 N-acetylgalactosaminyltransferase 2-like n=1 Tax=Bolinopsis microptera TaxID=2820187 RepID=UPI003078C785
MDEQGRHNTKTGNRFTTGNNGNSGELFNEKKSKYINTSAEELKLLLNRVPEPIKLLDQHTRCPTVKDCVTAIVTTHGKLEAVVRLIRSIFKSGYGNMEVIVINDQPPEDNEYTNYETNIEGHRNVQYHFVPPPDGKNKLGTGRSRNIALSFVTTPFFLQLDDDFVFTDSTNLETMVQVLATTDTDIVGGQRHGSSSFPRFTRYDEDNNALVKISECSYSE